MNDKELLDYFSSLGLICELYAHEPVFTAADGAQLLRAIPGAHCKNLFLKDKQQNYALVSVLEHKRVDLKNLAINLGSGRFSFGDAENLLKFIGVCPGSVTPFGLVHDTQKEVKFYLDQDIANSNIVNFHPLRNDQTVAMSNNMFLKFFDAINHRPQIIEIPVL